jgi:Universal stress protein family
MERSAADTEGVERILIPVANPANFESLIDLAILIKNPKSDEPIYPLTVVNDDAESRKRILLTDKLFANAISHARAADVSVEVVSRVDLNVAGGIVRAVKDLAISEIIIGWNGKPSAIDIFFGNIMTQVLQNAPQTFLVSKIMRPVNTFRRIVVVVPENAGLETGFNRWVTHIQRLVSQLGARLVFYLIDFEVDDFKFLLKKYPTMLQAGFIKINGWESFDVLHKQMKAEDLLFVINARPHTLSFVKNMERLPRVLSDNFEPFSFVLLFPEQNLVADTEGVSQQFIG